jgi:hypothetical protein
MRPAGGTNLRLARKLGIRVDGPVAASISVVLLSGKQRNGSFNVNACDRKARSEYR